VRLELLVIPAAIALLVPIQGWIDGTPAERERGERNAPPSIFETVPSPRVAPILALGHRETMADLLELRAANFFSRTLDRISKLEREHLNHLYATITALDPEDPGPWLRWSQLMFTLVFDPKVSHEICIRGLNAVPEAHPLRWKLRYELACIYLMQSVTAEDEASRARALARAGESFIATTNLPGLSEEDRASLRGVGARLIANGVPRDAVLQQEIAQWEQRAREAHEGPLRQSYMRRALEARSALRCFELQALVDQKLREGKVVGSLGEYGKPSEDPLGYGFLLSRGRVISPGVDAARLERTLEDNLSVWREAHPGQVPTPTDLGVSPSLPPYLSVAVTGDGVHVRVLAPGEEPAPFPPAPR
jgi:hypothetical protein